MKATPIVSLFVALTLLSSTGATAQQATSSEARMRSWDQHVRMAKDSPFRNLEWRAIGPKQAGARVEAIAVPSGSHGTIYAGIGSGNLWKTTNNGITWTPIFENESTFTIGDVAVAPSNPDIVWVGTGETQPRHSGYSFAGTGVFKSENAGETWQNMGLQDTHHIGKVIIDPNNPTGAVYSTETRRALVKLAETHGIVILADEVYADLAYDEPVPPIGALDPDAPVISFSSISKTYQAPGWRAGWLGVSGGGRLDAVLSAINELANGRLCSTGPMQFAIMAALTGNDDHKATFVHALRERAEVTTRRLNGIEGISCVPPRAAFYAMPKVELPPGRTDEDYVVGLLRATGLLCVYGSGFGTAPGDGFFRIVFLAAPPELEAIYDTIAAFTERFRARG